MSMKKKKYSTGCFKWVATHLKHPVDEVGEEECDKDGGEEGGGGGGGGGGIKWLKI